MGITNGIDKQLLVNWEAVLTSFWTDEDGDHVYAVVSASMLALTLFYNQ